MEKWKQQRQEKPKFSFTALETGGLPVMIISGAIAIEFERPIGEDVKDSIQEPFNRLRSVCAHHSMVEKSNDGIDLR